MKGQNLEIIEISCTHSDHLAAHFKAYLEQPAFLGALQSVSAQKEYEITTLRRRNRKGREREKGKLCKSLTKLTSIATATINFQF